MKYNLYQYELWNSPDGYHVNDKFKTSIIITLRKNPTDLSIIRKIKQSYCSKYLKNNHFTITGEENYTFYIDYNGIPLTELQAITD